MAAFFVLPSDPGNICYKRAREVASTLQLKSMRRNCFAPIQASNRQSMPVNVKRKEHWETIYQTKQPNQVSWTQEVPAMSLEFIHQEHLPKSAAIIDIGGGDSKLVDHLLKEGYNNITVLDISEAALERAKKRLGPDAAKVKWLVQDVLDFHPTVQYDLWHDRAAFHFQTEPSEWNQYLQNVKNAVKGLVIIGTFSTEGPQKCSGLEIRQYDEPTMKQQFESAGFQTIGCKREDHLTPSGAVQNFVFCSFYNKKRVASEKQPS